MFSPSNEYNRPIHQKVRGTLFKQTIGISNHECSPIDGVINAPMAVLSVLKALDVRQRLV